MAAPNPEPAGRDGGILPLELPKSLLPKACMACPHSCPPQPGHSLSPDPHLLHQVPCGAEVGDNLIHGGADGDQQGCWTTERKMSTRHLTPPPLQHLPQPIGSVWLAGADRHRTGHSCSEKQLRTSRPGGAGKERAGAGRPRVTEHPRLLPWQPVALGCRDEGPAISNGDEARMETWAGDPQGVCKMPGQPHSPSPARQHHLPRGGQGRAGRQGCLLQGPALPTTAPACTCPPLPSTACPALPLPKTPAGPTTAPPPRG